MVKSTIAPNLPENQTDDSPTLTFEEYKVYESDDDFQYELYKGKLIQKPIATALHIKICAYLVYQLQHYIAVRNLDLVVKTGLGFRTEENSSRIPDVVVCSRSIFEKLADWEPAILDLDRTPLLLIEVVDRDRREVYINKRVEYELANVSEYIIVDPTENKQRVRDMAFIDGDDVYTDVDYLPGQEMLSVVLPDFRLSVNEILCPPLVEDLMKEKRAYLQQLKQHEANRQRAERLAQMLRELGVDPDTV